MLGSFFLSCSFELSSLWTPCQILLFDRENAGITGGDARAGKSLGRLRCRRRRPEPGRSHRTEIFSSSFPSTTSRKISFAHRTPSGYLWVVSTLLGRADRCIGEFRVRLNIAGLPLPSNRRERDREMDSNPLKV